MQAARRARVGLEQSFGQRKVVAGEDFFGEVRRHGHRRAAGDGFAQVAGGHRPDRGGGAVVAEQALDLGGRVARPGDRDAQAAVRRVGRGVGVGPMLEQYFHHGGVTARARHPEHVALAGELFGLAGVGPVPEEQAHHVQMAGARGIGERVPPTRIQTAGALRILFQQRPGSSQVPGSAGRGEVEGGTGGRQGTHNVGRGGVGDPLQLPPHTEFVVPVVEEVRRGLSIAPASVGIGAVFAQERQQIRLAGHDGPVNRVVAVQVGSRRQAGSAAERLPDPLLIPSHHGVAKLAEA